VVALIVVTAFSVIRRPLAPGSRAAAPGLPGRLPEGQEQPTGPEPAISRVSALAYFPFALAVEAGGSLIAAAAGGDKWVLGYVIYGPFTIFLVIIPNVMAFWFARLVPFTRSPRPSPTCSAGGASRPAHRDRAGHLDDPPGIRAVARYLPPPHRRVARYGSFGQRRGALFPGG
jgi:hypothetical protein